MKKIPLLFLFMLAGLVSTVFGAELKDRSATLVNNAGTVYEVTGVFIHSEPDGFYESRFCLTIVKNFVKVAIPPENLISVEVKGETCEVVYEWMGERQTISGKVASDLIGGKGDGVGYVSLDFNSLKNVTFNGEPAAAEGIKPPDYEATLVLTDGTKVPVAKLIRISSQPYPAVPLSGVKEGTIFDLHNDLGFLRGETAPSIRLQDIKCMEFPTKNSITLTFRQGIGDTRNKGKKDKLIKADKDEDFLIKALNELREEESAAGKLLPKNWAYGFSGISSRGYIFVPGGHVKAIEFNVE